MERKIGEKFDFRGKQLVVEKARSYCNGCVFRSFEFRECSEIEEITGSCTKESRTDYTEVIFKYSGSTELEARPTESAKNDRKRKKRR